MRIYINESFLLLLEPFQQSTSEGGKERGREGKRTYLPEYVQELEDEEHAVEDVHAQVFPPDYGVGVRESGVQDPEGIDRLGREGGREGGRVEGGGEGGSESFGTR